MKHTPTPWKLTDCEQGILDADGHKILFVCSSTEFSHRPEITEKIIQCVNSHDKLLEAAKEAKQYFESLKRADVNLEKGRCFFLLKHEPILESLEKAIQKAEYYSQNKEVKEGKDD